ncbi:MAG: HpaII family restriction endonuclease [Methanomethylophilus sp.]|nr:HpaII family restriction endonuclease [Methanomethylophilus sp.]
MKGVPVRIIEPSERTAFAYRIEGGMDARDLDEIEAMDSGYVTGENWPSIVSESVDVRHRMRYMRGRSLGFRYLGTVDPDYWRFLRGIDPDLPPIAAWMCSEFYLNGTERVSDILENLEQVNPLRYSKPRANGTYRRKVWDMMERSALEAELGEIADEDLLSNLALERVPVGRFGSTEIEEIGEGAYSMKLVLSVRYIGRLRPSGTS